MASQELINIIIRATDEASAAAEKVSNNLNKIKDSSSRLSSIPGFDTMKTKLSNVAQTIDSKFGGALTKARNKFTSFKNGVGNVASTIKGKFGGALDGVRAKLSSVTNGTKNLEGGMSFLKGAVSMTAGMIGFELVNSLMETTRASLNARSSMQAFAQRLNMSGEEVEKFQQSLDEMQNSYKKIDMDVVGQQATDMAYRLGLPKTSLTELTETTAIFTDAMQRNGRSAEDSMLAMSDAMDGQFVRLKEIGIGQEDLMKNGWDGDINNKTGLLDAMNKSLKEQHYDDLAKSVDTLDDAWQVLSITLSNLLEQIIVPLTPAIVGIITAVTDGAKFIMDAFSNMPDWAKIGLGVGAVGLALGLLAGAAAAAETSILGLVASAMPGFIVSLYEAAAGFMAISIAGAPLWLIIAAIAAIAVAVFEVGKAFGWWTDVGSMIDAIWAGVQRLWSAFINHPAVQAAIAAISNAISTLWSWIQQAGQAVLDFFGINTSGNFDIVRSIIDGVGAAWEAMSAPIKLVIGVIQWLINTFSGLWSAGTSAWNGIMAVVGPVVSQIITFIYSLIGVFNLFKSGQLSLPQFIWMVLLKLWNAYLTVTQTIGKLILKWAGQLLQYAIRAGTNFVNGIINKIKLIGNKVWAILKGVVHTIKTAIQAWVDAAKQKAQKIVDGVGNVLGDTASAVTNALSGVKDAIVAPFKKAYDDAKKVWDDIVALANNIPHPAAGGEFAAGGETGVLSYKTDNSPIEVNQNLTLDFKNVPSHLDTNQLVEALTEPSVLMALTGNSDFQRLDAKVKQRLQLKVNRSRGV